MRILVVEDDLRVASFRNCDTAMRKDWHDGRYDWLEPPDTICSRLIARFEG